MDVVVDDAASDAVADTIPGGVRGNRRRCGADLAAVVGEGGEANQSRDLSSIELSEFRQEREQLDDECDDGFFAAP